MMICGKCGEPLELHEARTLGKATLCPICFMITLSLYGGNKEEKNA